MMSKKERKEVDDQLEELRTRLAMRIYPPVEPDVMPPTGSLTVVKGWMFNEYSCAVELAETGSTWPQSLLPLYSTKKLARAGLLHAVSVAMAKKLRILEKLADETTE